MKRGGRPASASWNGSDRLVAGSLFLITLLSRIPFRTNLLYTWDSVLYTRALERFDVTIDHPQPPGHLFYVGLVWLINRLTGDPNAAMVWISAFAAAAAVAMLYRFGRTLFSRGVALGAAALLATSLSFWVYSEIAYPYTLLAFLSIACAAAIYQTWQGRAGWVVPAALVLGVASGFREDLLPFLLPLLVLGWIGKPRLRVAAAVAVLLAAIMAWYVPSALLSGGFAAYQSASSAQTDYLLHYSSVFGDGLGALAENTFAFLRFLGWALAAAIPALAAFLICLPRSRFRQVRRDRRLLFLAAWSLPSVIFYILIHVGEYGYVFSFLPAALLAAVWGVSRLARSAAASRGERFGRAAFAVPVALMTALNMGLFLLAPPAMSADRLAARETILGSKIETIKENFNPSTTLIVSIFDEQQVDYYLPGFKHFGMDPMEGPRASLELGPRISTVVIFDDFLRPGSGNLSASLPLAADQKLTIIRRRPGEHSVVIDWNRQEVSLESAG